MNRDAKTLAAWLKPDHATALLAVPCTVPFQEVYRDLRTLGLISATIAPGWTEWDHRLTEFGKEVRQHLIDGETR